MKFKKVLLTSILISSVLVGCNNFSFKKVDDENIKENNVKIKNDDEKNNQNIKISVASVSISQILAEMNVDIVGRPTTKLSLPEEYVNVSEIGSSFSPDFEKVLLVGTELLIADELFKNKIEKTAQSYGIETFYVNTSTYQDYIDSIEKLGIKINKENQANAIIQKFKKPLENLENINKNLKVAIIFGSSESNMLATENTYVGSLLKEFEVTNIADEIIKNNDSLFKPNEQGYINLNLEQLLKNQPNIILRFGHGNVEEAKKSFQKLFDENPAFKNLDAIKNNKIYDLDSSIFGTSANIFMDEALNKLGEILNEQ